MAKKPEVVMQELRTQIINTGNQWPEIGQQIMLPVSDVSEVQPDEWEKLVRDCLAEGIVVTSTDHNGLRVIRYVKGGLASEINNLYLEAIGYYPGDEGDKIFSDYLMHNLPAEYLAKLVGVALFYQTCQQGGANMGAPVPQHIVEQMTQIELIITMRNHLRRIEE